MKAQILTALIEVFLRVLQSQKAEEVLRSFADMVLDFIENKVAETGTQVDDKLALPLCSLVRKTFDIPDND